MLAPLLVLAATMTSSPSTALCDFVARLQPAFSWKKVGAGEFTLTSQTWQGSDWHHTVTIQEPSSKPQVKDLAYLVVTGDRVDRVDLPFGQKLANASHLPVVTVFNVPNQPLFGLREDDLIARSFEEYIETGDPDWPLLFPMVNSVAKTMDMVQQDSHGLIKRFIVTGESKRGWTSWLVGALNDKRVIGIAPVAFDNLNFAAQLQHQMESWAHLSEMLSSYSGPGLVEETKTEQGKALIRMVDPYAYLGHFNTPVLIIRGSNDRYWTADATNLYWDSIRGPKVLRVLPNEGHDFMNDDDYIQSLAHFPYQCLSGNFPRLLSWENGFSSRDPKVVLSRLWMAGSQSNDFRDSKWSSMEITGKSYSYHHLSFRHLEQGQHVAFFVEFRDEVGNVFTTPIHIEAKASSK